jgi:hypothetical protein
MTTLKQTYTHKGWFFLCPVYMNADEGDGMSVSTRHPWLDWWFDVNAAVFDMLASASQEEQPFPFKVTQRLKTPITLEFEVKQ